MMCAACRLAMVVVTLLFAANAHAQTSAAPTPEARAAWGFARSDLRPHPDVRFGVLANGMRYALMRGQGGERPAGLAVRLLVRGGASIEAVREAGFMHVLEHLVFHRSNNLPTGALLFMLPHQGMKRFSDFNAFTSFDETVYRLDLPRTDVPARATALMLMREIATELYFGRRTIEAARRNVLAEIGTRDAGEDRAATARDAFFMPGTKVARGPVAGTAKSVRRAGPGALRRLYARAYTPGRATLVVVGDIDPDVLEEEIAARFADWRPPGVEAADPPDPVVRTDRGTQARLFVDPAAATRVTIATVEPLGGADAGARRDESFLQHLGARMLSARLAAMAKTADAPFAAGDAAIYDHFSTARLARIELAARDRDWRRALDAGARALRRALDEGFTQAELDTELAAHRRAPDPAPRDAAALADGIADAVGRNILFTAPADPRGAETYLAGVRLDAVDAAFRRAWGRDGRLIFVAHDRDIPNASAQIVTQMARNVTGMSSIR